MSRRDLKAPPSDVDTRAHYSWSSNSFIEAPSSRVFAFAALLIALSVGACLIAAVFVKLDVAIAANGTIDYVGGAKDLVAPATGLLTSLTVKEGDTVTTDQLVGSLQMLGTSEAEVKAVMARLESERHAFSKQTHVDESIKLLLSAVPDQALKSALINVTEKEAVFLHARTFESQARSREIRPLLSRRSVLEAQLQAVQSSTLSQYLLLQRRSLEEERGRLDQQIAGLENGEAKQKYNLEFEVVQAIEHAQTLLKTYVDLHQIRSPVNGMIAKISTTPGTSVQSQQPILTVLPRGAQLIVQLSVQGRDISRVREGNRVLMDIDAFPAHKFGYFEGRVLSYQKVPETSSAKAGVPGAFLVRVSLSSTPIARKHAFIADDSSNITFISGMTVKARLISKRSSIIAIAYDKIFGTAE